MIVPLPWGCTSWRDGDDLLRRMTPQWPDAGNIPGMPRWFCWLDGAIYRIREIWQERCWEIDRLVGDPFVYEHNVVEIKAGCLDRVLRIEEVVARLPDLLMEQAL